MPEGQTAMTIAHLEYKFKKKEFSITFAISFLFLQQALHTDHKILRTLLRLVFLQLYKVLETSRHTNSKKRDQCSTK